jgi:hypothetical protein
VSLIAGDSSILFSTGRSSSFSGDNVSSDTYTIVKDNATVLKVQNDSKNIVTSALKFSVSAFGKD